MATEVTFNVKNYSVVDEKIVRTKDAPLPKDKNEAREEDNQLMSELARYIEARLVEAMGFTPIPIPGEDSDPFTTILASPNFATSTKLLLIIQNQSGGLMGIFSRSLCLDTSLNAGSMLPYVSRAIEAGFGVVILRPNTNSVVGPGGAKTPILGSETPELHALCVWDNVVRKAEHVNFIALLSYGNGATLAKDLLENQIVRTRNDPNEANRIKAFVTIEASSIIDSDTDKDMKTYLENLAMNFECNKAARGYNLVYRKLKLGTTSLSLGLPAGVNEISNVAASIALAKDPVFAYIDSAERAQSSVSKAFSVAFAQSNGLNSNSVILENPNKDDDADLGMESNSKAAGGGGGGSGGASPSPPPEKQGFFARLFGGGGASDKAQQEKKEEKLTVEDFDLIKIVGKGAFGKVMLVKKKPKAGVKLTPTEQKWNPQQIYAMKVLKKSVVAAKGQVEHTKSERDILFTVKHPFIVCLRYAFQNDEKLYLITDYYNGGTLFIHLRKCRNFTEERARFYAAQLLLALDHLHSQNIIYRDLKLENVLLDHLGNIALTDFGLSKQNIDKTGATTFCGTAEYIAPELLKGKPYGKAVDWWSFGILLFEMILGRTPFYDKNRKLMFYRIINTEPVFPSTMSQEVQDCLRGLLAVDEEKRYGCLPDNTLRDLRAGSKHTSDEYGNKALQVTPGAVQIIETSFFSEIDFELLWLKQLVPPYKPEVEDILDTKYVPKQYLDAEARDSIEEKKKGGKREDVEKFDAFTFAGESNM